MVERWLSYDKHIKLLQAVPTEFQVEVIYADVWRG